MYGEERAVHERGQHEHEQAQAPNISSKLVMWSWGRTRSPRAAGVPQAMEPKGRPRALKGHLPTGPRRPRSIASFSLNTPR
jgi:hypothetical protein